VVFRAVLAVGAELQGGNRQRGPGAVGRTFGLANFPANEAAVLGVLGVVLVSPDLSLTLPFRAPMLEASCVTISCVLCEALVALPRKSPWSFSRL